MFKPKDTVFYVKSNSIIIKCTVISANNSYVIVQPDGSTGGIRLPLSRIFKTEEDALASIKGTVTTPSYTRRKKNQYDYM